MQTGSSLVLCLLLGCVLAQQPPPPGGGDGGGGGGVPTGGGTGETTGTGCPTLTSCGTAGANAYVSRSLSYDSGTGKFSGSITTNLCPAWSTSNNAQPDCIEQAIPDPSFASGPNPAPLLGRLGMTLEAGTNIYGPFEAGFVEGFACTGGDCAGGIDVLTCQLELTYECDGNTYDDSLFEDQCGGHASPYHIHTDPVCSYDATDGTGHSALLGVALDGYGIYGKYEGANFELPCLDACRGHTGTVPGGDDWSLTTSSSVYHYHVKALEEDVYPDLWTVGCFGPVASVAECEALYSTCGDDSTSVTVAGGVVVTYDYYCPCWEPPACAEPSPSASPTPTPTQAPPSSSASPTPTQAPPSQSPSPTASPVVPSPSASPTPNAQPNGALPECDGSGGMAFIPASALSAVGYDFSDAFCRASA